MNDDDLERLLGRIGPTLERMYGNGISAFCFVMFFLASAVTWASILLFTGWDSYDDEGNTSYENPMDWDVGADIQIGLCGLPVLATLNGLVLLARGRK